MDKKDHFLKPNRKKLIIFGCLVLFQMIISFFPPSTPNSISSFFYANIVTILSSVISFPVYIFINILEVYLTFVPSIIYNNMISFISFNLIWFYLFSCLIVGIIEKPKNKSFNKKIILAPLLVSVLIAFLIATKPCDEMGCISNIMFIPVGVISFFALLILVLVPYSALNRVQINSGNISIFAITEFLLVYFSPFIFYQTIGLILDAYYNINIMPVLMPFYLYLSKSSILLILYSALLVFLSYKLDKKHLFKFLIVGTIIIPSLITYSYYYLQSTQSVEEVQNYIENQKKSDELWFNQSIESSNFDSCKKINYFMLRARCESEVALKIDNPELCKKVTEQGWKQGCYEDFALKYRDSSYCDLLPEGDRAAYPNKESCERSLKQESLKEYN